MPTMTEAPIHRLYVRRAGRWVTARYSFDEIATCPDCRNYRQLQLCWVEGGEDRALFACGCGAAWHDPNWSTPASMATVLTDQGEGEDHPGVSQDLPPAVRALADDQPRPER